MSSSNRIKSLRTEVIAGLRTKFSSISTVSTLITDLEQIDLNKDYKKALKILQDIGKPENIGSIGTELKSKLNTLFKMIKADIVPEIGDCKAPEQDLDVTFDDIAGMQKVKDELKSGYLYPFIFKGLFVEPTRGLLLYGPPGTGKTMIAKATVSQFKNVAFFAPTAADIKGKYEGDTQKNIVKVFECANNAVKSGEYESAVIFFDEFEELARTRSDTDDPSASRAVPTLLQMMQGIKSNPKVSVIAATNLAIKIDLAVWRRFSSHIAIDLPDAPAREQIIRTKLAKAYNFPVDRGSDHLKIKGDMSGGMHYKNLINTFGSYLYSYTGGGYYTDKVDDNITTLVSSTQGYSSGELVTLMEALVRKTAYKALCVEDEILTIYLPVIYKGVKYYVYIDRILAKTEADLEKLIAFVKTTIGSNLTYMGLTIGEIVTCGRIKALKSSDSDVFERIVTFSVSTIDFKSSTTDTKPSLTKAKIEEFLNYPGKA